MGVHVVAKRLTKETFLHKMVFIATSSVSISGVARGGVRGARAPPFISQTHLVNFNLRKNRKHASSSNMNRRGSHHWSIIHVHANARTHTHSGIYLYILH